VSGSVLPPGAPFPPRVCVVMLSALGDVVHALPVVTAIKRHAPRTRLTWILQPGPAELVRGHPAVDEILVFERAKGVRAFLDLRRMLAGTPFDLVLDLQPYFKAGVITAMTRAPIKLGIDYARARDLNWMFTTHRLPARPVGHVADQFLEYLDVLAVPHGAPEWGIAPTAEERARARAMVKDLPGPLVGFVVATSKPAKNWPAASYADLAGRLQQAAGASTVLLGGTSPLEQRAAETILGITARPVSALGCGLRTTLALLEACDIVVSPDTGPYHMCVAMNVPAVGLFGYTNPKRFGPYGRFQDLMVDGYGEPGETYDASSGYRMGRMQRITVDVVMEKVRVALGRRLTADG
jgi:heptosyltransferase I